MDERPRPSLSLSNRLWLHLQKNLSAKPTPPLQAFVSRAAEIANQYDSDEILDHENIADEVIGLDELGIGDHETACPGDDNITQQIALSTPPSTRIDPIENYNTIEGGHQNAPVRKGDDLLIEALPTAGVPEVNGKHKSVLDVLQHGLSDNSSPFCNNSRSDQMNSFASKDTGFWLSNPDEHALPGVHGTKDLQEEDLLFEYYGEGAEYKMEGFV